VFTRSGSAWAQQGAKLTGSGEVGANCCGGGEFATFGTSVALSSEGNTAVIGGGADNDGIGAAWAFTRSRATWTQLGPNLTANDEIGDAYFGNSVALSSDGRTALVGGPEDGVDHPGAAWVFVTPAGNSPTKHHR
jgi:hypothetical protein